MIYDSLRKLGINQFFSAVLVSDDNGWRKPHKNIFHAALRKLQIRAEEAVFIGDSPLEDIKGAQAAGVKTVFVPSQFYTLKNLHESRQKPDIIVEDLCEICTDLFKILSLR